MRYLAFSLLFLLPLAAYAGNIKDTDLITSNNFFLPPSTQKTVFIQTRNSSDNQEVSFHDLGARLSAKGYQVVNDPDNAHYILLANIVYCNITKPEMPVEPWWRAAMGPRSIRRWAPCKASLAWPAWRDPMARWAARRPRWG